MHTNTQNNKIFINKVFGKSYKLRRIKETSSFSQCATHTTFATNYGHCNVMQFNLKFKLQSVHCITLKHILINYPRNKCRTQPPNANRTCRHKENTKYPNYNNTSCIFSPIPLLSLIVQKYLTMFVMCYNLISSVEQL